MSVSSVKNWRDKSPVWGKQTIQKTPTAAVRQLDLLPGIEPGLKEGLVQSWVTLRKSLGNRLGYSESSLFATIGRSEPSIPVQRGRAVQGPYCYPKASIFEPCLKNRSGVFHSGRRFETNSNNLWGSCRPWGTKSACVIWQHLSPTRQRGRQHPSLARRAKVLQHPARSYRP